MQAAPVEAHSRHIFLPTPHFRCHIVMAQRSLRPRIEAFHDALFPTGGKHPVRRAHAQRINCRHLYLEGLHKAALIQTYPPQLCRTAPDNDFGGGGEVGEVAAGLGDAQADVLAHACVKDEAAVGAQEDALRVVLCEHLQPRCTRDDAAGLQSVKQTQEGDLSTDAVLAKRVQDKHEKVTSCKTTRVVLFD